MSDKPTIERHKGRPVTYETRYCKKTVAGNVVEFMEMSSIPEAPRIKKISATEYMTEDGEILEFNKSDTRADNTDSLRKSFRQLRALINANCADISRLHWVTLTYAENMTDTARLYKDFVRFWQKFKRWCVKQQFAPPEYIAAIEPQKRGAWHMHCIFIWSSSRPYVDNNGVLAPMWGQGFTKIQAVPESCDNLGAYLSAYLADMELGEEQPEKVGKKYEKGARLRLYPVGVQIFRHSRGVKKPTICTLSPSSLEKEKASSGKLTFEVSYQLTTDDGKTRHISKSYYNTKR